LTLRAKPEHGYFGVKTILRDVSILPYRSFVSQVTVAVKVSLSPGIARSFGTRHEYLYKPPQQKGSLPVATCFPDEFLITNVGLRAMLQLVVVYFLPCE